MNSIDHLEALQESIGELVSLARIGKRFVEIAEQYLKHTCAVCRKEATAYPVWYVVAGKNEFEAGPFFSRPAAEEYIKKYANHPDRCQVKCESGLYSTAYEAILELAATILGGNPR